MEISLEQLAILIALDADYNKFMTIEQITDYLTTGIKNKNSDLFVFSIESVTRCVKELRGLGLITITNADNPAKTFAKITNKGRDIVLSYRSSKMTEGRTGWFFYDQGFYDRWVFEEPGKQATLDYSYPKITHTFSSPMLNFNNLLANNGYEFFSRGDSNNEIENCLIMGQVILGRRPMGFIECTTQTEVDKYKKIAQMNNLGFLARDENNKRGSPYWDVGLCAKGTFIQLFDMDALIADYKEFLRIENYRRNVNFDKIADLKERQLEEFLSFDYGSEKKSIEDFIISGLILGHPIESTVAIMLQHRFSLSDKI